MWFNIPIFRQVDAVFYDDKEKTFFRMPVVGIFCYGGDGIPRFYVSDSLGAMDDPTEDNNFIAFEFDGKQEEYKIPEIVVST